MMATSAHVLMLCTANSARSEMVEGILRCSATAVDRIHFPASSRNVVTNAAASTAIHSFAPTAG